MQASDYLRIKYQSDSSAAINNIRFRLIMDVSTS